jgi:hypothetical protein
MMMIIIIIIIILALKKIWRQALRLYVCSVFIFLGRTLPCYQQHVYSMWHISARQRKPLPAPSLNMVCKREILTALPRLKHVDPNSQKIGTDECCAAQNWNRWVLCCPKSQKMI